MFKLIYKIFEETKKELSVWTLEQFENEICEIEGQIKLDFNDKSIGVITDSNDGIFNVYLIEWFNRLYESARILEESDYVCLSIPESNGYWIEIIVVNERININILKIVNKEITNYVVDYPLEQFTYKECLNVVVNRGKYIEEVKKVTREFVKEIKSANNRILESFVFYKLFNLSGINIENMMYRFRFYV